MKHYVDDMILRYGQQMRLLRRGNDEELEVTAFVQPQLKKQLHAPVSVTPLGAVSTQRWIYIGPGEVELHPGDSLGLDTTVWEVQETHPVCCGKEILYRWALLRPGKETAL